MKSFFAKTEKYIFVKLRYSQLKLKKTKENEKKIFAIFDLILKNIPLFVISHTSFGREFNAPLFILNDLLNTFTVTKSE